MERVAAIQDRIDQARQKSAGQSFRHVTLICVSKYHSVQETRELYHCGIRHFAENRPESLLEKQANLPDDIVWHYIGNLQSRKVKSVVNRISYYHALDRLKIAKEIQKHAQAQVKCFIQVNVSGEASKHGLAPSQLLDFVESLTDYDHIEVVGLMTMAPSQANAEECMTYFSRLAQLRDRVVQLGLANSPCKELSMGMSRDFEMAVAAGASYVRLGSIMFQPQD
ncbi:YggS family pyridoxal phosphate-dependent enzyme [Aerococcus kribbianus]|uniref:Pyridoxal phosphate homeostasis protein n=1 Tax=Aerococcus kribbianus TaxID=2999064 RepID=A0A9X3FSR0_9LACT|nr:MULTISPECIES: YggS family pyridoxal phosphate-dependent enzyme [unclassified Aerococcus]MCZ0717707.1 YggS family pyridoxal phosphate-dependent enzyme [Aerococcus sp. YH-aer221]MCZ0725995.1 YggS family pyridoxal phosphate-dependent enzyme [Aerococcus sp. YH-aer222]